eukprot:scaffold2904_cov173-Amphora_coffeaeformis.AAC.6
MPKVKKSVDTKKKNSPATKHSSRSSRNGASAKRKSPILSCIANLHRTGLKVVPRAQVVALSGYTKDSLRVTLCKLRKQGYVDWDDAQTVRLTDAGWDKAAEEGNGHATAVLMTNEASQLKLKETYKLTSGVKGQLFDLLLDGKAHRVSDLMKKLHCTNTDSFRVFVSALTSKNLAERIPDTTSGDKMLRLTDICFPFGRPAE